ncbi:amidohydrolase family protein [Novosphingobium sp. JCM 18896]|uniref:amidohydrolase family protein n=1 Tax=Novosphingobium sp. JCM 18896 TaxID=2989731 RepID=UPI00222254BD|nr:amidohydrolase family protein [Novosphingobium sp. JCM 18896]MCW1431187.1 amidohydrolase family protein [Novosphingobium sp. JCM 18896]
MARMLIRNAEVWGHGRADLRLSDDRIAEIGGLAPTPGETVIDARGGALLPGLHDHHIHLAGLAVRAASVPCGPPEVNDAGELTAQLRRPGSRWIRGIGYHESVMGLPDRHELDTLVADRPLRLQHRSGRLWLFNSLGLETVLASAEAPAGLDRAKGHLFDEDAWLQTALASTPPDFAAVSAELAGFGVTGMTDMSPRNDPVIARHFARQRETGSLRQHALLAGTLGNWTRGPAKLHLHEAQFPDFDETQAFIAAAHDQQRGVAVHCVSEIELVFALAAIEAAGAVPGDRIEHASVASPELVARMAALGLSVCVQPHFVAERGDRYLADVEPRHHGDLYRLRSLVEAGIPLAGGSDAPFVSADPWQAMTAAVSRRTRDGQVIGAGEALTPEEALTLYFADPLDLTRRRRIVPGEPADLCLLDRPWAAVRENLSAELVRATFVSGDLVYQAPA